MEISWTRLPFRAHNREEFGRGLTEWLSRVFYETLPEHGYEIREEQIYTAFRMARALTDGETLFAEAGAGTGKTFAYLLPAVCHARFWGKPVLIASSSGVLQAQLMGPAGDIQTLSAILDLEIDVRMAADPGEHLCRLKADRLYVERPKGWQKLYNWSRRTKTGARSEQPEIPDDLWEQVAWDPVAPCDTCRIRGTCSLAAARRYYRAAGDLVVTSHRLFVQDLLTRAEREASGLLPLLPGCSAVVLDEGHHVPETWQRAQGFMVSADRLERTLGLIAGYARQRTRGPGHLLQSRYERLAAVVAGSALDAGRRFLGNVLETAGTEEGKRSVTRDGSTDEAADGLIRAVEALQDELATEEAMNEGTEAELTLRAYQARLDEMTAGLALFRSAESLAWLEGTDLWVVPRHPLSLCGPQRLQCGTPLLFSSATLEPDYMAGLLQIPRYASSRVGVPFNLAAQVLVYRPKSGEGDAAQTVAVIQAMKGRTLVLLNTAAEMERYRQSLTTGGLPWRLLFEGDAERGAMLQQFRDDTASVLVGTTFWEGADFPGEALSCVVIPRLPFPAHDPLIRERREQSAERGEDPFLAVDLPEMLVKLKQGAGRLIRTAHDRGVLALLDQSWREEPWGTAVAGVLPEGAEVTSDLSRVAGFCG